MIMNIMKYLSTYKLFEEKSEESLLSKYEIIRNFAELYQNKHGEIIMNFETNNKYYKKIKKIF